MKEFYKDIFEIANYYGYEADIKTIVCLSDEIGKTVFLTREEAEQKLKEMEGD